MQHGRTLDLLDELEGSFLGEVDRHSRTYIRWVQQSLNRLIGAGLVVDGIRGSRTSEAIRRFQQRHGLRMDGIVGPRTERALVEAGGRAPPGSSVGLSVAPIAPRPSLGAFRPVPVESPGGGRIRNKRDPRPADIVVVRGVRGKQVRLHRLAADAWQAMVRSARADGIREPLLLPTSGYRSSAHQERLWRRALQKYGSPQLARRWVAPPGSSAHQSGRAIDLYLGGGNSSGNVARLRRLPAYRWLVANARRFGFYPYEREPWHWEYNPPARASEQEYELGC